MVGPDPYTMEVRLCDNSGLVSHERVEPGSPGTVLDPDLTYMKLLNNLRAHSPNPDNRKPYPGDMPPFPCTGSAHLAGQHIRCTSPAHRPGGASDQRWEAAGRALKIYPPSSPGAS